MRPYVAGRCYKFTRSREHHGRSFSGKTNLRRTFEKSERQHGRRQAAEELRLLEQENHEREADERHWAESEEEYERDQRMFAEELAAGVYDDDDPWHDDYNEQFDGERLDTYDDDDYNDYDCRYCDEDAAYEDLTRQERYERRERDHDGYDWDADPDFNVTRPSPSSDGALADVGDLRDRPSMAGARDGYDLNTWRGRKR